LDHWVTPIVYQYVQFLTNQHVQLLSLLADITILVLGDSGIHWHEPLVKCKPASPYLRKHRGVLPLLLCTACAIIALKWCSTCFISPKTSQRTAWESELSSADGKHFLEKCDQSIKGCAQIQDDSSDAQHYLASLLIPCVVGIILAAGVQPVNAAQETDMADTSSVLLGVLPPEEQQGYVQNALGYFNLIFNFLLGFIGTVFGPVVRQLTKPGLGKYAVVAGGIGFIVFIVLTVRGMLGLDVEA